MKAILHSTDYSPRQVTNRGGGRPADGETARRSVQGCSAILSVGAQLHLEARRVYQATAQERAEKVDRLRQQVQAGAYRIDTAGLCDSLLAISQEGSDS